jgi:hypothetical protein
MPTQSEVPEIHSHSSEKNTFKVRSSWGKYIYRRRMHSPEEITFTGGDYIHRRRIHSLEENKFTFSFLENNYKWNSRHKLVFFSCYFNIPRFTIIVSSAVPWSSLTSCSRGIFWETETVRPGQRLAWTTLNFAPPPPTFPLPIPPLPPPTSSP